MLLLRQFLKIFLRSYLSLPLTQRRLHLTTEQLLSPVFIEGFILQHLKYSYINKDVFAAHSALPITPCVTILCLPEVLKYIYK